MQLCELLPALLSAQNALVESMPVLNSYANMTQKDVDDCRADDTASTASGAVSKAIESALNENTTVKVDIDTGNGSGGLNAAEEAEAAGAAATAEKQ